MVRVNKILIVLIIGTKMVYSSISFDYLVFCIERQEISLSYEGNYFQSTAHQSN